MNFSNWVFFVDSFVPKNTVSKIERTCKLFWNALKDSFRVCIQYTEKITRSNDIDHKLWRLIFWYRLEMEIHCDLFVWQYNNERHNLLFSVCSFVFYFNIIYTSDFITIAFLNLQLFGNVYNLNFICRFVTHGHLRDNTPFGY